MCAPDKAEHNNRAAAKVPIKVHKNCEQTGGKFALASDRTHCKHTTTKKYKREENSGEIE
jgi:hypothetical protein